MEIHHKGQIQAVMEQVFQKQNETELAYLVQLLSLHQANILEEYGKSKAMVKINSFQPQEKEAIREKCNKIRKKNLEMLKKMLNLREIVTRMMYMSMSTDSAK